MERITWKPAEEEEEAEQRSPEKSVSFKNTATQENGEVNKVDIEVANDPIEVANDKTKITQGEIDVEGEQIAQRLMEDKQLEENQQIADDVNGPPAKLPKLIGVDNAGDEAEMSSGYKTTTGVEVGWHKRVNMILTIGHNTAKPVLLYVKQVKDIVQAANCAILNSVFINHGIEIDGVMYGDDAEHFAKILIVGEVFSVNNFYVIDNKANYAATTHEFCLKLTRDSTCLQMDQTTIPNMTSQTSQLKYIHVDQLNKYLYKNVHVCAVIVQVGESRAILRSKDGSTSTCLNIIIADDLGHKVYCTLWGKNADDFPDDSVNKLIVLFGTVKVFNSGINIKIRSLNDIKWNPTEGGLRIIMMKKWLARGIMFHHLRSVSSESMLIDNSPHPSRDVHPISAVVCHANKSRSMPMSFTCCGMITRFHRFSSASPMIYDICPTHNCKLENLPQPKYCQRCHKTIEQPAYGCFLSVEFNDYSGGMRIKMFGKTAETLFGKTIKQLGDACNHNPVAFDNLLKGVLNKPLTITIVLHINMNGGDPKWPPCVQAVASHISSTNLDAVAAEAASMTYSLMELR